MLNLFWKKLSSLRHDDSGVAYVITLAVFLMLFLMSLTVYAVGSLIQEKMTVQNAADAAAYSAATAEADGLSRIATINRALAWTYAQMTKREMDYIVFRWLDKTVRNFQEDADACEKFNDDTYFFWYSTNMNGQQTEEYRTGWLGWTPEDICLPPFVPTTFSADEHQRHNESLMWDRGTWFCGWAPGEGQHLIRIGYNTGVRNIFSNEQSGFFVNHEQLKSFLQMRGGSSYTMRLASQIDSDRRTAGELNNLITERIGAMEGEILAAARFALEENLPAGRGDEYRIGLSLPKFSDPYTDPEGSVFKTVKNNEEDELEFLSSAYRQYLYDLLFGDGIDQWMIRGSYQTLTNSGARVRPVPAQDYYGDGLMRGYKTANREEGRSSGGNLRDNHKFFGSIGGLANPLQVLLNMNPLPFGLPSQCAQIPAFFTRIPDLIELGLTIGKAMPLMSDEPPSAYHTGRTMVEKCDKVRDSYGLVSEYHWGALRWWCPMKSYWVKIVTWTGYYWQFLFAMKQHYKVEGITSCPHNPVTSTGGDQTRQRYSTCYIGADRYVSNTHGSTNKIPGYMTMGHTRIYGDDEELYQPNYYTTAHFKPVKVSGTFFQNRIQVVVAKKMRNPLSWMFGDDATSERLADASFSSVFNPYAAKAGGAAPEGASTWITGVSIATAAPVERDSEGYAIPNRYDVKYNQLTASDPAYPLPSGRKIELFSAATAAQRNRHRVGCPHPHSSNLIDERLKWTWNLSETDWDAVFVPVRYAHAGYEASYDSMTDDSTAVEYRAYEGGYGGDGLFNGISQMGFKMYGNGNGWGGADGSFVSQHPYIYRVGPLKDGNTESSHGLERMQPHKIQ